MGFGPTDISAYKDVNAKYKKNIIFKLSESKWMKS